LIFDVSDRVVLVGTDSSGNTVQRMDPTLLSPVTVKVDMDVATTEEFLTLKPGESLTVDVNIVSIGDPVTWYIYVTDTQGFYTGRSPIT
jgi:hypothetical protein